MCSSHRPFFAVAVVALLARAGSAARNDAQDAIYIHSSATLESTADGMDPKKVSEILTYGLDAITSAITIFSEDPPDIEEGFETCQLKLWKLVQKIVPKEKQNIDKMKTAKEVWDTTFENAPSIVENIMDFRESSETASLISALRTITTTAIQVVSQVFPDELKYLVSLGDLVDGIGESWDHYRDGDTSQAVESIWNAMKTSVDDVLPSSLTGDATYQLVMSTIDASIGKMSAHVLEYKRKILNSKVCYKRSAHRERVRPSSCQPGFEWDQMALCLPIGNGNGADCLASCGKQAGMCDSFCGRGRACCKNGHSGGAAECEGATGFVDHNFTHGTSSDYHQCVEPGPNLAFSVGGAGESSVAGLFVRNGEHSGKPRYTKVHSPNVVMEWSNKRSAWRFYVDNMLGFNRKTLYTNGHDTDTFPTSGWTADKGAAPVPKLVPYSGKGAQVAVRSAQYGSHPAMCEAGSDFAEKVSGWCLGTCPAGFKASSGRGCTQLCGNKFPAESMGVCGKNKGEIMIAMTEMMTMVASGAMESAFLVAEMQETGVSAEKLSGTIDVFIEMGKPFARPQCPIA